MTGEIGFNLYLITDRKGCAGRALATVVEEALEGGARALQLREKDLPGRDLYEMAMEMRSLTLRYGAKLFINGRVDIAMAAEADGVHLGERSIPVPQARKLLGANKLIGVSCHCLEDAVAARDMGADFITYGPVYYTHSKAAYGPPLGLDHLRRACSSLRAPVLGLGGIRTESVELVLEAGAAGIAAISLFQNNTEFAAFRKKHLEDAELRG